MGSNTLILLKNDCLSHYKDNAYDLMDEICSMAGAGQEGYVGNSNDPEIISVHHADDVQLILAGHNKAFKLGATHSRTVNLHDKETQIKALKDICAGLGYNLVKKRK